MTQTLTAVFDGLVLRPDTPLDLESNKRYAIAISPVDPTTPPPKADNAWDTLDRLVRSVNAPSDWLVEHDRYLYGTPQ